MSIGDNLETSQLIRISGARSYKAVCALLELDVQVGNVGILLADTKVRGTWEPFVHRTRRIVLTPKHQVRRVMKHVNTETPSVLADTLIDTEADLLAVVLHLHGTAVWARDGRVVAVAPAATTDVATPRGLVNRTRRDTTILINVLYEEGLPFSDFAVPLIKDDGKCLGPRPSFFNGRRVVDTATRILLFYGQDGLERDPCCDEERIRDGMSAAHDDDFSSVGFLRLDKISRVEMDRSNYSENDCGEHLPWPCVCTSMRKPLRLAKMCEGRRKAFLILN